MLDKFFSKESSESLANELEFLNKSDIPLLYRDEGWLRLFGSMGNENIDNLRKALEDLVDERKTLEKRNNQLQGEKVNLMKKILKASEVVNIENNPDGIPLLDQYKDRILKVNEEIDEIIFRLEMLPKEIREKNLELLKTTVDYGYDQLREKRIVLDESIKEMDLIRNRMRELIEIKVSNEEWINNTYKYFHGLLGSEIIERIDREKLD